MSAKQTVVIVESPTKVKSLDKYLGSAYHTIASVGHVRDLPGSGLGVDVERDFKPEYQVIPGKEKVVAALRKAANGRDVLIATDPDREGEAIAWHIAELIRPQAASLARVEFEEITKSAVTRAISKPRKIDNHLVDAQQARRVLDRLVGYLVSPLLWKTVKTGISAGRVQSVALRLVNDREEEILAFIPDEYWTVEALFALQAGEVTARLVQWDGEKAERLAPGIGEHVVEFCTGKTGVVISLETKTVKRSPAPPFTTSTLQQLASSKLGFGTRRTMTVAQQLYEGIELPGEGPTGLITYMRTDSVRLAGEAIAAIRKQIVTQFGNEYLPDSPRQYKTKDDAQDAHEAIRPTDPARHPDDIRHHLSVEQAKLYDLIWKRTMASQMETARFERQAADIEIQQRALFRVNGQRLIFDGFLKVYGRDDEDEETGILPAGLIEKAKLPLVRIDTTQHFTEPPPRYSEATLVKELDERGIGRPSTYASIVQTLLDREYVQRIDRKLQPTNLGRIVSRLLVAEFPDLFDVEFTAKMEGELDSIADGKGRWHDVIDDYYRPLSKKLLAIGKDMTRLRDIAFLPTSEVCPNEHVGMQLRIGRYGAYLRCPECSATKNLSSMQTETAEVPEELLNEPCEKCGGKMAVRAGKFGVFLGCTNFPTCSNIRKLPESAQQAAKKSGRAAPDITPESLGITGCPACGSPMKVSVGRFGPFFSCTKYPDCKGIVNVRKDKTGTWKTVTPRPKVEGEEPRKFGRGATRKTSTTKSAKTPLKQAAKKTTTAAAKSTTAVKKTTTTKKATTAKAAVAKKTKPVAAKKPVKAASKPVAKKTGAKK